MAYDEQWEPIAGYEGLYSVSSLGRIRAEPRDLRGKNGSLRPARARFLSWKYSKGSGYPQVNLSHDGRRTTYRVHILVAIAFVPKPGRRLNCVIHRDGDIANPAASNLKWVDDRDKYLALRAQRKARLAAEEETPIASDRRPIDRHPSNQPPT